MDMLFYRKILIISDNLFLINQFHHLIKQFIEVEAFYCCTNSNKIILNNPSLSVNICSIDIKNEWEKVIGKYDLIFSLHCKQLFPVELIDKIKCINVHPGFNPYNRGWFPQVFSILNSMKAGATIHEIDEQLDHGAIIAQKEITVEPYDTSLSAYEKIQQAEVDLLKENLEKILSNSYTSFFPEKEGNINLKKDFNALCEIDLKKRVTMGEAIDYLRAMTHGHYKNAYFTDKKTGERIFINIDLKK